MAAIVSNKFRTINATGFIGDVKSELSNLYIGVGKSTAWQDAPGSLSDFTDEGATLPVDTIDHANQARANLIGMKLIKDVDISHVIPRYDWEAGKEFTPWDSADPDIYDLEFYCLTNDFKVYKFLDRPAGTGVTDIPTKVSAAPFTTADQYTWKYMYTILAADAEKFLTRSYMPVKTLTVETTAKADSAQVVYSGGSSQIVKLSNENPSIMIGQKVSVTDLHAGSFDDNQVLVEDITGKYVTLTSSTNSYTTDGDSVFTFGNFADTNPFFSQQQSQKDSLSEAGSINRIVVEDGGSGYNTDTDAEIAAEINIVGDGSGATVAASGINTVGGVITRVIPDQNGTNYSVADVVINNDSLDGSDAVLRAVVNPASGHGVDPVTELGGFYVGINTQISGVDDTDIATNQDFRQITIIKNPTVAGKIQTKTEAENEGANNRGTFRATKYLTYDTTDSAIGDAVQTMLSYLQNGNDVLLKGPSLINGVLPRAYAVSVDTTNGRIYYVQDELTSYQSFANASEITYSHSGAPLGTEDGITIITSGSTDFDKNSGEILFIENRDPIQRSGTQIEDIKLIIEF